MRVLLDTHALLWALRKPERLSIRVREIVSESTNELFVSAASQWEISTKVRLGKLPEFATLVTALPEHIARLGASELAMSSRHALAAGSLDWDHADPFDRMLATQSILEGMFFVSNDAAFSRLVGVQLIW